MKTRSKVTYKYDAEDYRIIPIRIIRETFKFEAAWQVEYNFKLFGFDRWRARDSYSSLEDAIAHIEHTTGEKFEPTID